MKSKQSILITCKITQYHHFWSSTCGRFWFKSSNGHKDTNDCAHADLCSNISASRRTHRANEGPEAGDLLAGDRKMGGLWGKFWPSVWHVGVLAHLLPHLQEPHPAATHHEHRLVRQISEKKNTSEQHLVHEVFFWQPALHVFSTGVMIFDCEEKTMASLAEKMVTEMVKKKEIRPDDREGVLKSLCQKRRYPPRHLSALM